MYTCVYANNYIHAHNGRNKSQKPQTKALSTNTNGRDYAAN